MEGHSITVADSGIDRDHGDFNGRIQHVESVIWGDSSTEDEHSGHGTHVACTVLGNGSRGGYAWSCSSSYPTLPGHGR